MEYVGLYSAIGAMLGSFAAGLVKRGQLERSFLSLHAWGGRMALHVGFNKPPAHDLPSEDKR